MIKITCALGLVFLMYIGVQAQKFDNPIVGDNVIFEEKNGLVAVEAEYFYKQSQDQVRQWYRTSKDEWPKVGRDEDGPHCKDAGNNAYLEILPDTRVTHGDKLINDENFAGTAGNVGVLHYKVKINTPGRYYVWVRAYSTGSEDNGLHVGMNGHWPESGQRLQWCEGKNTWRWESKQRTEANHCGEPYKIYLDLESPGVYDIQFSMREDGFEFDRFLLSNQKDYFPEGVGPDVIVADGVLPSAYPVVDVNPEAKVSFLFSVEKAVSGTTLMRAIDFPVEGTNFYVNKNWLAINPDKNKSATTSLAYNGKDALLDLLFLGVGENDGGSIYSLSVNDKLIGKYTGELSVNSFEEGVKYMKLFEGVEVKRGDMISVTAEVGSKDGKEWSRGRWAGIALIPQGKGKEALGKLSEVGTIENVGGNGSTKNQ